MSKSYYLYILANKRHGTLYVGVTNDLVRRIHEHKNGLIDGFTKRYGVKMLVWYGETPDIEAAVQREKTMKRWPRAWKINVIEEMNPEWRDLYDDLIA
ncbi:MAG: GIY-YIG nuclease family protein [Rhizobiales bacterium]|nr:GIY-YIG nuclease family protein [Hyphomicrobiales bacterium]